MSDPNLRNFHDQYEDLEEVVEMYQNLAQFTDKIENKQLALWLTELKDRRLAQRKHLMHPEKDQPVHLYYVQAIGCCADPVLGDMFTLPETADLIANNRAIMEDKKI